MDLGLKAVPTAVSRVEDRAVYSVSIPDRLSGTTKWTRARATRARKSVCYQVFGLLVPVSSTGR